MGAVFDKSQRFYDAIYSWKDYPAEVERLLTIIRERAPRAGSLLDVACGTGKHLELLRGRLRVEGADVDPAMLSIARERLGDDVPLHLGDMVALDLGRTFDVVTCLFSSIGYVRTREGLGRAVATMARHAAPHGLVIVEPWFLPEAWSAGHVHAIFVDEDDLKVARMTVSEPLAEQVTVRFHYLVATPNGVEDFTEDHVMGMFGHEDYLAAFRAAGLTVDHDPEGLMGRGMYVGRKPG
jgi:SAM-dependent methyltransferase